MSGLLFASPWVLLALPLLPALWWLLRVTPPAPRREVFPAVRLLLGLRATAETPARTPLWLLALRIAAAALIILGLARPILDAGARLPGAGPVTLVVDDGWASASDWTARAGAIDGVLDRAEREGRGVALLTTAPGLDGSAPTLGVAVPAEEQRGTLAALRPKPWPSDRAAAAAALRGHAPGGSVVYVADGLAGPDWTGFADAVGRAGPVTEIRADIPATRLLLPPRAEADRLVLRAARPLGAGVESIAVLAQAGDGRTLARVPLQFGAGTLTTEAPLRLPPELRNRLARLTLEGNASAGSVVLLDEAWRRRPVGLLGGDPGAETPLTGPLYYLRRALTPYTEVRAGDLDTLLARDLSVLVLADRVVTDGPEADRLAAWVERGGVLVRFAGPAMAEHPDALLPVRLLAGDRQLGGALSWSEPAALAAFPPGSPFAGLAVPEDVRVRRQVLAEPGAHLAGQTWARLQDGTPLVTEAPRGAGRLVLFHVTANADWSDLPLSGLFVDMLRRIVAVSVGVAGDAADGTPLAPAEVLDGFGQGVPPMSAAAAIEPAEFAATVASPRHPPGLYGPENGRRALNLSAHAPALDVAPAVAGARVEALGAGARERPLGPLLIALAVALLAADLLASLRLRGLLRPAAAALLLGVLLASRAASAQETPTEQNPALITRLAYVVTGDEQVDGVSRMGLAGLSDYVNRRTAAVLGDPAPVTPGQDDLSFYPLLYWPVSDGAEPPNGAAAAALNAFMAHGGIILIDTRGGGGSGAGFGSGGGAALQAIGKSLAVPALAPLTSGHVLARAFYLLQDFPGRYVGDSVWVQRDQDRTNDSVSPVVIGSNDWAAAWAVDAEGRAPFATIPGGTRQRTLAFRFGVNLVMYALTGNYKGDQVHVPSLLERLGQ